MLDVPAPPAIPATPIAQVTPTAPVAAATLAVPVPPAAPIAMGAPMGPVVPVVPTGHHVENPVHPLCDRDRVIINSMVNFVRDIDDPYARAQAHAIVRSRLVIMVMIPRSCCILESER